MEGLEKVAMAQVLELQDLPEWARKEDQGQVLGQWGSVGSVSVAG
jgi:hypothetical protein